MSRFLKAQSISDRDIEAVVEVLQSDWLTTGPKVGEFELAFADFVGAKEAVAVSNGTAALHAAMFALDIQSGDEVLVPAVTFAATANCVVYQGGTPVFVDVDAETLLINPELLEEKITSKTKAIIAVDYAGQPCDYDSLQIIAGKHNLSLVADACHALGGKYKNRAVGTLAKLSTFSLHPVKNMTTGEGGVITTSDSDLAEKMRRFRNHGINSDHRQREALGTWYYEMIDLGYNYRLTDFQCALGMSQLLRLPEWIARRQEIATKYTSAFAETPHVEPLGVSSDVSHAYHLFVVHLRLEELETNRDEIFNTMRSNGLPVNVHYIPVHLHPFYRTRFGTGTGLCPVAEAACEDNLSMPIHPNLDDEDVEEAIEFILELLEGKPCLLIS